MAILVRSGDAAWMKADRKVFAKERHLQDLLLKSPELIETFDGSQLVLTDEAGLSGGTSADLVGVTSDGDILIVEAKLATNPEIRRKIIGQIFEYAARLWETDYATFDDFFKKRSGISLLQTFTSEGSDFDGEVFRKQVDQNLRAGRFHLLIAVDEMNDELNKILSYISACGQGFKLEALAIRLYESGGLQILAPQRYGQQQAVANTASQSAKPSVQELVENSINEDMKEKMQLIVDLWRQADNYVFAAKIGLSLRAALPGKVVTLFWATPNETWGIQPNFSSMQQSQMPATILTELRTKLSVLPGLNADKMMQGSTPIVRFSLVTKATVELFVQAMLTAVEQWRESLTVSAE